MCSPAHGRGPQSGHGCDQGEAGSLGDFVATSHTTWFHHTPVGRPRLRLQTLPTAPRRLAAK